MASRRRAPGVPAPVGASRIPRQERRGTADALRELAREQSALRRVATLVAREVSPTEVFAAVATEVAHCLEIPLIAVVRFGDGTATQVGASGAANPFPVGLTWILDGTGVASLVAETAAPARVEDYAQVRGPIAARLARTAHIRSAVGVPIAVSGRLWGAMMAMATESQPLPPDTEERLANFTELVATAIANAQVRDDLHRLVDEQSALRRVATLVATAATPEQVFDSVCRETGALLGATTVNLARFTPDGLNHTLAGWSLRGVHVPAGTRLPMDGAINVEVQRTAAPARMDTYERAPGELAARLRALGIRSEVGAPVVVGGSIWGGLFAGTDAMTPLPPGTEFRLASFAELIGLAVANATDRAELVASRARIVAAGDQARRRLARDLHDGAQQRLLSVVLCLELAQQGPGDAAAARELTGQALHNAREGMAELRELAAGVHPSILTNRGLHAAADSLAQRSRVRVSLDVPESRYPPLIEAAAYFVLAEALTNVDKHAKASRATVSVRADRDLLVIDVEDDGTGGAEFDGSGLVGLKDRVEALGGGLALDSAPGHGTHLHATLRLPAPAQP